MVTKTPFIRAALEAAIVALAISGGSVSALAHAKLLSVDRPPAVVEGAAGTELRLRFSEGIELPFSKVTIVDGSQKEVGQGKLALDPADGHDRDRDAPRAASCRPLHHNVVCGFVGRPQGCREPRLHQLRISRPWISHSMLYDSFTTRRLCNCSGPACSRA